MKKINNLSKKKEVTTKKRKAKTFNISRKSNLSDNLNKLFNFLGNKVIEDQPKYEDLLKYQDTLESLGLNIDVLERESLIDAFNKTNFKSSKYIKVTFDDYFYPETFDVIDKDIVLGVDCDSKSITFNHYLMIGKEKYSVVPLRTFIGFLELYKIIDTHFSDIKKIIIADKMANLLLYKYDYTNVGHQDVLDVLVFEHLSRIANRNKDVFNESIGVIKYFILELYTIYQSITMNIDLNNEYVEDNNRECARAFETKKNINKATLKKMESSILNKYFSFVEFDNDVDIKKEEQFEKEFKYLYTALNLNEFLDGKKLDFRIRKLGKHKALGIYFSSRNCLCIDASSPKSFMHEFGHFIDFTFGDTNLSNSVDFMHIVLNYRNNYNKVISSSEEENGYLKSKANYYNTPTEVFARSFEVYLAELGVVSSLTKSFDEMTTNAGYVFDDKMKIDIVEYFDNLINCKDINLNVIEELTFKPTIKQVAEIVPVKVKVKELKLEINNQFAFDI